MARTAPGNPSGVRTLRARAPCHLPHVALAFGRGQPARISRGVVGRVQHGLCRAAGRSDRRPDGLVERRARGGVQQHRGQHPLRRDRRQLDDHPTTHGMAHEDGLAHAERIQRAQRQVDPMAQVGRIAGQVGGDAVARRVQRDDQEPHSRQPAQQSHVGPPAEGDAVQEHQRHALAAHGHAHLVPVVERHDVVGQPDPGSRSRLAGYRCLTHMIMVTQPRTRWPTTPTVGLVTVLSACDEAHDVATCVAPGNEMCVPGDVIEGSLTEQMTRGAVMRKKWTLAAAAVGACAAMAVPAGIASADERTRKRPSVGCRTGLHGQHRPERFRAAERMRGDQRAQP